MVFLRLDTLNQSFISLPDIFRPSLLNITNQSILFSYQQCSAWLLFWFGCYLELGSSTLPFGAGGFGPMWCTAFPQSIETDEKSTDLKLEAYQFSYHLQQFNFSSPDPSPRACHCSDGFVHVCLEFTISTLHSKSWNAPQPNLILDIILSHTNTERKY